jgi:tyrosyl-tRNA synthetase
MLPVEDQLARIRRGVDQIVPLDELRKKLDRSLKTNTPLRVKYGIDPTGIDVHLGHTVPLRKLRVFQELGHHAVLIIGNYTALVGDPSGRDQTRARLTQEQVERNAQDYLAQIRKIIAVDTAEVRFNGEWFGRYSFLDTLALTSKITVQRMLERDDFTKRFRAEPSEPIYLHECLYPLMQGQDSVEVRADVELGGSEQLFNLMVGRRLQEEAGQEPQVCVTMPILRGLDGAKRMGKSLGNYVGVGEPAAEQFAKVMSIPDELMVEWFTLLTDRTADDVRHLTNVDFNPESTMIHPMEAKKTLAKDVVSFYHGDTEVAVARRVWEDQFSRKIDPDTMPEVAVYAADIQDGRVGIVRLIVLLGLAKSNNEARQKVMEGAVTIGPDRERITDPRAAVAVSDGLVVRLGSRRIVRIRLG